MSIGYLYLLGMVVLTSVAQIFVKRASAKMIFGQGARTLIMSLVSVDVLIGGGLTVMAPILYLMALTTLPLSTAFFSSSLTVVFVVFIGKYIFHETISRAQWAGITLIVAGIVLFGL